MTEEAARTIVIGNWHAPGSYSRKCWEEIATQFIPDDRRDAFARPWEGPHEYRPDTEDGTTFFPIPLTAPGSATSEKDLFRDSVFAYLNSQNVTSLVLVCDSPYARRTLDILGPLSTRPIFVIVASHEELLSSQMSALADDYVFRLCPNNRQQADLVLMATRLQNVTTLLFWTAEKEDSDEYLYHAKDLYESLTKRAPGDIAFLKWNAIAPPLNAALFVAGYSATVAELGRISEPLAKARLVMFSDGCTPVMGLKERVSRIRSSADTFAIRSKVEPDRIATETVSFLRTNAHLTPRVLAAKVKDKSLSLLGTIPVSFHGTDNSAIPFESTELLGGK